MNDPRKRVLVAGGTGLTGRALVAELGRHGYDVVVVSRRPKRDVGGARVAGWDEISAEVHGALAIVNLAGSSIGGGRWTARRKRLIVESRVQTTRALVDAVRAARERPAVFVCASGIDYAGDAHEVMVDEESPPGDSFLSRVTQEWESEAARVEELGVRRVSARISLVLARDATAVRLIALPFRMFAGGRLGNGQQWFPWIHVDDLAAAIRLAIEDDQARGALNVVAPGLVRQSDVAAEIGRTLRRPSWLPAPAPLLRLALGEQADLLLHGQRAIPRELERLGFEFRHPQLAEALEDVLR